MNLSRSIVVMLLVALMGLLAMQPAAAATRTVLVEGFTQWNCPPCAAWNPQERAVLDAMGRDTVVSLKYHVWWPGANNDVFHLWNVPENTARTNYYGVNAVPDGRVDGTVTVNRSSGNAFRSQIRQRRAVISPCTIECSAILAGQTSVSVMGTVTAEYDMLDTDLRLFAALITDRVTYTSPPGANGETIFDNIFRDLAPGTAGQAFTLSAGGTYDFQLTLNKDAAWDADDLTVVVFIQRTTARTVHQAAFAEVTQEYGLAVTTDSPRQSYVPLTNEEVYVLEVSNMGTQPDTFTVELGGEFPAGWTHSVEAEGVPAQPDQILVPMEPQSSRLVMARVTLNNVPGSMSLDVTVSTPHIAQSITESFRLMGGVEMLIVDDDGGASYGNFEQYYVNSVDAAVDDHIWGWWDRNLSPLDEAVMAEIPLLVWYTGRCSNGTTLTTAEQTFLASYLDNGGKLFLSGQGIAYDIRNSTFITDYLHISHLMPVPGRRFLEGIAGNPLGEGLAFSIQGGDGANNQVRQNAIHALDSLAQPIFNYINTGVDTCAAVNVRTGTYSLVFLAFGFEAVDSASDRNTIMDRALTWLLDEEEAVEPTPAELPAQFSLGQNYPNPFNPETIIPFALPVRADVTLRVFDLLGREVAVLARGLHEAGAYNVQWNAAGLSSGLYFYQLEAAAGGSVHRETRKLMLLK